MTAIGARELFEPFPGRVAYTLKLAFVTTIAAFVFFRYQLPEAPMGVFLSFFMNKQDRLTSVVLAVVLTILVALIVGSVMLTASFMLDHPGWRMAMMWALALGFAFLGQASKLGALAMILAMLSVFIWDEIAKAPTGDLVTRALLYVEMFVFAPACVTIVWNLAFGAAPGQVAAWGVMERLKAAAGWLRDPTLDSRERLEEALRAGDAATKGPLRLQQAEKLWEPERIEAMRRVDGSSFFALSLVGAMARDPTLAPDPRARARLAAAFESMSALLAAGRYPRSVAWRAEGDGDGAAARPVEAAMSVALRDFARAPRGAEAKPSDAEADEKEGFFKPDAFSNPYYRYAAINITAAAMACYFFYTGLDWYGVHTCMISVFVVALDNTGQSVEKLMLRVAGTLVGGSIGVASMVFLIPRMDSGGEMLVLIFLVSLFAGWFSAGGERISYAGLQLVFAFVYGALHSAAGPSYDLVVIRDRMIGIVIGDVVAYLALTRVFPRSVARGADVTLKAAIGKVAALARRGAPSEIGARAAAAWSSVGKTREAIDLAAYEPASARPHPIWIERRRAAADALGDVATRLCLLAHDDPTRAHAVAAELERIERGESDASAAPGFAGSPLARVFARIARPLRPADAKGGRSAHVQA